MDVTVIALQMLQRGESDDCISVSILITRRLMNLHIAAFSPMHAQKRRSSKRLRCVYLPVDSSQSQFGSLRRTVADINYSIVNRDFVWCLHRRKPQLQPPHRCSKYVVLPEIRRTPKTRRVNAKFPLFTLANFPVDLFICRFTRVCHVCIDSSLMWIVYATSVAIERKVSHKFSLIRDIDLCALTVMQWAANIVCMVSCIGLYQ